MVAWLWALIVLLSVVPASAEISLPPGFTTSVYVTGQGFDPSQERGARGIPAGATMAFDQAGALYLARTGARFRQGEIDDLWPIYRIPPGGARITRDTEARYLFGPPLRNGQIAGVNAQGEVFVTTYDRDRKLGALYRMKDDRPLLFAGGTPPPGSPPLLRNPEGVAFDGSGNLYVADREQGFVVKLDPAGKVLDPQYLNVGRPRTLAFDEKGHLWIGSDGTAATPFQDGSGQIWRASPDGAPTLLLQGPLPTGTGLSPGGAFFVAQRRTGTIFAVTPEGKRIEFAASTEDSALRGLAFAPVTPQTRRAGIAGDLFVIAFPRQNFMINEVIRISGPFDEFVERESRAAQ